MKRKMMKLLKPKKYQKMFHKRIRKKKIKNHKKK